MGSKVFSESRILCSPSTLLLVLQIQASLSVPPENTKLGTANLPSAVFESGIQKGDTSTIKIKYSLSENDFGELELFDITGQKLLSSKLLSGNGSFEVNSINLQEGIYIYRVNVNSKELFVDKVIIK